MLASVSGSARRLGDAKVNDVLKTWRFVSGKISIVAAKFKSNSALSILSSLMFAKVWTGGLLTWLCLVALNCVFFYLTRLFGYIGSMLYEMLGLWIGFTIFMKDKWKAKRLCPNTLMDMGFIFSLIANKNHHGDHNPLLSSPLLSCTEGCSSSESGWTMYIASPMHEGDSECSGNDDDNNIHITNFNYGDGKDEGSDDSMASDASSGPSHHEQACENGQDSHGMGMAPFQHDRGDNIKEEERRESSSKKEKKDLVLRRNSASSHTHRGASK
ncbi:hypothetical protein AAG906_013341 [Vitis piasezkii]